MNLISLVLILVACRLFYESYNSKKYVNASKQILNIHIKLNEGNIISNIEFKKIEDSNEILWQLKDKKKYFFNTTEDSILREKCFNILFQWVREIRIVRLNYN